MIYTLWHSDESDSYTFAPGTEQPRGCNGTVLEPRQVAIHRLEADSWEEAMQKFYDYMG